MVYRIGNKHKVALIISLLLVGCNKHVNDNTFVLRGQVKPELDSISIYPRFASMEFLVDSTFYRFSTEVDNGGFSFEGVIPHPYMLFLLSKKGYSEPFYIEPGTTSLSINLEDLDRNVLISQDTKSKTQLEYESLKKIGLDSINELISNTYKKEELMLFKSLRDSLVISHLKKNPNSYVSLWYFIDGFCRAQYAYNQEFDNALQYFSEEIKETHAFKVLKERLSDSKNFNFNDKSFVFKNINLEADIFNLKNYSDKKYILIDFWFHNCAPCLREMPEYIPLYRKYKNYGFEIISISVDNTTNIANWKKTITKNEFDWIHYLDVNGTETYKLGIHSFPTTYLLNNEGKIIDKGISPIELEKILIALEKGD